MLQQAVIRLEARGMYNAITLLQGDVYRLDSIAGLHITSLAQPPPTFDVIFARDALPADQTACVAALRHWTTYLTPGTGCMVATFAPTDADMPHVAGMQCIFEGTTVLAEASFMLEEEWAGIEQEFRDLASLVGLRVDGIQRVCFKSGSTIDLGDVIANDARARFAGTEDKDPSWVDEDGAPTRAFKLAYLYEYLDDTAARWKDTLLEGMAGMSGLGPRGQAMADQMESLMEVVPRVAKVAAVMKHA